MLETTQTPNATLYFQTTPVPAPSSRNARVTKAISKGDTEAETDFRVSVRIRPLDFRDSRARAIVPQSVDFSSGNTYAGGWRLTKGQKIPDWVVDGIDCSLTFTDGKPMTAVFYRVPGRTEEMRSLGLGPEFVVNVKRVN